MAMEHLEYRFAWVGKTHVMRYDRRWSRALGSADKNAAATAAAICLSAKTKKNVRTAIILPSQSV